MKNGFTEAGFPPNVGIGITESLADARSVFLTPNATVIYQWACADVELGPMVVEVPPGVLGLVNDAYFRFLGDMGQFGPDQAKGGKFLLVREDYTGALPTEGYYVTKTRTNNNLIVIRSFVQNGDLAGTVQDRKGENPDLSVIGGCQSAGTEVRKYLGDEVQHGPRQQFQIL